MSVLPLTVEFKCLRTPHVKRDMTDGGKIIGCYKITRKRLGQGTFGRLKLAVNLDTNEFVTVKIMDTLSLWRKREFVKVGDAVLMQSALHKVYREIALMQNVVGKGEGVVELRDVAIVRRADDAVMDWMEVGASMTLLSEGRGGAYEGLIVYPASRKASNSSSSSSKESFSLKKKKEDAKTDRSNSRSCNSNRCNSYSDSCDSCDAFINRQSGGYSEELAKCFIRDVASGLRHLHSRGVAHRDVKPDNILLDRNGRARLGDFGCATVMNAGNRVTGTEGTYAFLPPECVNVVEGVEEEDAGQCGTAVDMWALGVCLWCYLFGGKVPFFDDHSLEGLFQKIAECQWSVPASSLVSPECLNLIGKLLNRRWQARPSAEEVLEHPWILSADFSIAKKFADMVIAKRHRLGSF